MRVLEMTKILCFGRIRSAYLARLDSQFCLSEPPATQELFIYKPVSVLPLTATFAHLNVRAGTEPGAINGFRLLGNDRAIVVAE